MLLITKKSNDIVINELDSDNEIEFYFTAEGVSTWISIEQTKQLIEFLTKQIEGKCRKD